MWWRSFAGSYEFRSKKIVSKNLNLIKDEKKNLNLI